MDEAEFYRRLPEVRATAGDRAVLRAMHIFDDNRRVTEQTEALRSGRFDSFLRLVNESGESSWKYLQNVIPSGSSEHQEMAFAIVLCKKAAERSRRRAGAWRRLCGDCACLCAKRGV